MELITIADKESDILSVENKQLLYRPKLQRVLNNLPAFSPILNRLLASLASEDVRFSELASLIEKDTVLSGHVLRLVNSAAMARRSRINSISHAVSVLGIVRLRNFLLSLSIARLWQSTRTQTPWSMAKFNLHGAAVALMADLLAQHCDCSYPEGAFLAGLLHDYGKLLIAAALPEQFLEILKLSSEEESSLIDCERKVTGFTHAELSAMTLKAWNLPEDIVRGVEFHHQPEEEAALLATPVKGILLGRLIFIADVIAHHLGLHVLPAEGPAQPSRANALAALEMFGFHAVAPKLLEQFDTEYDAIRAFF
ncbi:HDOD domain-containing protein [Bryobacter aggregatus]|uniref:HDOD domain-containing protein n=1 Tax=Bryobacter aggregatus TaxID=360054 RepID=UPI0004E1EAB8|nr:HDOD domain-containing protein [Bryobacter aggregatus]